VDLHRKHRQHVDVPELIDVLVEKDAVRVVAPPRIEARPAMRTDRRIAEALPRGIEFGPGVAEGEEGREKGREGELNT
tara:strand:- start:344 stop:577 length:234 start_codon:yes stop_codon:yes gene_type:complete